MPRCMSFAVPDSQLTPVVVAQTADLAPELATRDQTLLEAHARRVIESGLCPIVQLDGAPVVGPEPAFRVTGTHDDVDARRGDNHNGSPLCARDSPEHHLRVDDVAHQRGVLPDLTRVLADELDRPAHRAH